MTSYIVAINGPDAGQKIFLTEDQYTLGRHPDCDIIVEVGAVSRYHAKISKTGNGGFQVEDLGSRNGTYVNDEKIEAQQQLNSGDSIRVCDVTFEFKDSADTQYPATTTMDVQEPVGAFGAVMVDDEIATSTIMSKFEVSSRTSGGVHLTASPEVKLNALLEITRTLTGTLSLDEVLPKVLDGLFRIFLQADRGFVILKEADGNMVPRYTNARRDDNQEIRISRTIVKHVTETREAVLSADAAADSRFEMSQSITDFKIRSIMCAPLISTEDEVIGVLQIDTVDQRKRFQKEDLEVLVTVAMQAAAAIERAKLHDAAIKQNSLQRDLMAANQVQIGFLPSTFPQVPSYDFYHYYLAANSVGGDYYDYVHLPDGTVAILVGDVVGHGVAASLMMAKLSAEARYCLASEPDPEKAIFNLNNNFTAATPADKFVTLALLILDPNSHQITLINAGHNPPILRKKDGTVVNVAEEEIGLPIGIMEDMDYEVVQFTLDPDDMLLVYTDGINEAMNASGDQYGMERMFDCIQQQDTTVEEIGKALIQDCRKFMGDNPQFDDICLVAIERRPAAMDSPTTVAADAEAEAEV